MHSILGVFSNSEFFAGRVGAPEKLLGGQNAGDELEPIRTARDEMKQSGWRHQN